MTIINNIIDHKIGIVNNVLLDFECSGLSLPSREYYTDEKFKVSIYYYYY